MGLGDNERRITGTQNFEDQMCLKTVISRACKIIINSSDDSVLFTSDEQDNVDLLSESVQDDIAENANTDDIINIDNIEVVELESPSY